MVMGYLLQLCLSPVFYIRIYLPQRIQSPHDKIRLCRIADCQKKKGVLLNLRMTGSKLHWFHRSGKVDHDRWSVRLLLSQTLRLTAFGPLLCWKFRCAENIALAGQPQIEARRTGWRRPQVGIGMSSSAKILRLINKDPKGIVTL